MTGHFSLVHVNGEHNHVILRVPIIVIVVIVRTGDSMRVPKELLTRNAVRDRHAFSMRLPGRVTPRRARYRTHPQTRLQRAVESQRPPYKDWGCQWRHPDHPGISEPIV